ncbi:MAG: hypothetical protein QF689_16215 [Candidatus Latescibacteria bacterium]|jgi:hypothetical protein|nr:hypothetical protein [Candidatus Latescibacterota bacterium]MDP7632075.1 hypothetical protein [Candidatus Latescibacterota bacterium]|tara:strand:- start:179 stop:346 length:168 start_codon:yes stop_codon:yes gene_type:complete
MCSTSFQQVSDARHRRQICEFAFGFIEQLVGSFGVSFEAVGARDLRLQLQAIGER